MESKILIMGENQDYFEAEISSARLKKGISKIIDSFEGNSLDNLRIKGTKIPAYQLKNYGGTILLTERTVVNETMIDGLERFFKSANKYAEKYNASYVLVQDLKIKGHYIYNICGFVQLLIK